MNRRGELVGYYTEGGGLTYLIVRNAGHMVPISQPHWAREIVTQVMFMSSLLSFSHKQFSLSNKHPRGNSSQLPFKYLQFTHMSASERFRKPAKIRKKEMTAFAQCNR